MARTVIAIRWSTDGVKARTRAASKRVGVLQNLVDACGMTTWPTCREDVNAQHEGRASGEAAAGSAIVPAWSSRWCVLVVAREPRSGSTCGRWRGVASC